MANNNEVFPVDENDTDVCVTLELDNGETLECEILTIFDVEDQDYIALLPVDEHGTPLDEEVIIYRYAEDEEGTAVVIDLNGVVLYKTRIKKGLTILKIPANARNKAWIATLNGKMMNR